MKTALLALTLALAAVVGTAEAADRTVTLAVKNMSCVTCPITVKAALKRVPGVRSAEVAGDLADQAHHHEFAGADGEATQRQREQDPRHLPGRQRRMRGGGDGGCGGHPPIVRRSITCRR